MDHKAISGISVERRVFVDEGLSEELFTKQEDALEKQACLEYDIDRFVFALSLMNECLEKHQEARILEIGAKPYFFSTLILQRFPQHELVTVGAPAQIWPGTPHEACQETLFIESGREVHSISNYTLNVEKDLFPLPDGEFDLVLCMAVLEHLAFSPSHALCEMHRVLRPRGKLILTVPNSLQLKYLLAQLFNHPVGNRYSGYGVYGRHHREYSKAELEQLVQGCGYKLLQSFTKDYRIPWWNRRKNVTLLLIHLLTSLPIPYMRNKRQDLVIIAEATGQPRGFYPEFLYKNRYDGLFEQLNVDMDHRWLK